MRKTESMVQKLISSKINTLSGNASIPGDKSISHRCLMLGALAIGETTVSGMLEGEDVLHTADAMRAMGAKIDKDDKGVWHIHGAGLGTLLQPEHDLEMGNSGTSTRLLMGLVAGHSISAHFTGDASLSKRPMQRVMDPLSEMGAHFEAQQGCRLPLRVIGARDIMPITYRLPVASAQVKSAVMLAGLNARGRTSVIEEKPTRDHTENMLRAFGGDVQVEILEDGAQAIHVTGQKPLKPCHVDVPADPSSAAFPAVAAILVDGADIVLPNIGINPRRAGVFDMLKAMGAKIIFKNRRIQGGEPVCDLHIKGGAPLKGIDVPPHVNPSMIDEFPIFAVAASCAQGKTVMRDLDELRVKESDRLAMMAKGLSACGVKLEVQGNDLIIHGNGSPPQGGAEIETALDHRIAMSFLILGCVSKQPVTIDDAAPIATSFPGFTDLMNGLGCDIKAVS